MIEWNCIECDKEISDLKQEHKCPICGDIICSEECMDKHFQRFNDTRLPK